jgi:hypothetical protein
LGKAPVDGAALQSDYAKFCCFLYIKGCCFLLR